MSVSGCGLLVLAAYSVWQFARWHVMAPLLLCCCSLAVAKVAVLAVLTASCGVFGSCTVLTSWLAHYAGGGLFNRAWPTLDRLGNPFRAWLLAATKAAY